MEKSLHWPLSSESLAITEQRELLVQFMTHNNESMPWFFDSEKLKQKVITGNHTRLLSYFIIQLVGKWLVR